MRIFDSSKNRRWIGAGFTAKENSLTVLKIANFYQQVELKPGEYTLRLVGKKKVGVGGIDVEIVNKSEVILGKFKVDFSSSTWSEQVFQFKINKYEGLSKIRVVRSPNSVGTVEITRISLDAKLDDININIVKDGLPSNDILKQKINILAKETKKIDKTKEISVAFIIPYGIYGGAEVYVKNLVNNFPANIKVNLLYLKENNLINNIYNLECHHFILEEPSKLIENLQKNNYDFLIYYNRADVYTLLSRLKIHGDITSNLIEIYHSDFIWPGSLSSVKERKNLYRMVSISPMLTRKIDGISSIREVIPVGIDVQYFCKNENNELKKSLGLEGKKIVGTVARLSKEKNIDGVLSVAKELLDFHFIIIGDGPERNSLVKRMHNESISNVTLLGHIDNLNIYYNIFDAFLLLSTIEGTPISIIESMASEVPVFTTEVGAINDLIKDSITGFIVSGKPEDIAEIIRCNFENKEVTRLARLYVERSFNIKINSDNFTDLFFI